MLFPSGLEGNLVLIVLLMLRHHCCVKVLLKQAEHCSILAAVLRGNTLVDLHVLVELCTLLIIADDHSKAYKMFFHRFSSPTSS